MATGLSSPSIHGLALPFEHGQAGLIQRIFRRDRQVQTGSTGDFATMIRIAIARLLSNGEAFFRAENSNTRPVPWAPATAITGTPRWHHVRLGYRPGQRLWLNTGKRATIITTSVWDRPNMSTPEMISVAGVYLPVLLGFLFLTAILYFILRWPIQRLRLYRFFWHPALAGAAAFVILLSTLLILIGP